MDTRPLTLGQGALQASFDFGLMMMYLLEMHSVAPVGVHFNTATNSDKSGVECSGMVSLLQLSFDQNLSRDHPLGTTTPGVDMVMTNDMLASGVMNMCLAHKAMTEVNSI